MQLRSLQRFAHKSLAVGVIIVLTALISLAFDGSEAKAANESFYALLRSKTSPTYSLAIVNPADGVTTSVKDLDLSGVGGHNYHDLRSAGYSSVTNRFYAFDPTYQELFAIEPQSGRVSFVGIFSPAVTGGITAMAINDAGDAYALGENTLLYRVLLSTAELYSGAPVSGINSSLTGIESMVFSGSKIFAYAEHTPMNSSVSPELGQTFTLEQINSVWKMTDFHMDNTRATGTMDAYGIVVQGNTFLVNQLTNGENKLQAASYSSPYQEIAFASRGVLASGSGMLVRGLYPQAPVTMSFDSRGGTAVSTIYGVEGLTLQPPVAPTQAGKSFEGWFTSPTGGTKIAWPYTLTSSTTVYAQWNSLPATLSFDSHGGSAVSSINGYVGDDIAEPTDPTLANYGFDGWYTSASGGTQVTWPYPLSGDTTLHAVWSQSSATMIINKQNGSSVVVNNSFAGVEIDQPEDPTKAGAIFKGWYDAATGGTQVTWPYTLVADVIVYGQWNNKLTFVSQGGTPVDSVLVDEGSLVNEPSAPTFAHRTFDGWFTAPVGGTEISWPYVLATNTSLYAQWSQIPATLSFDSHGGSSVDSINSYEGELISEPAEPTKTNAAFEGWFTAATGGEKVNWVYYLPGNTTLHAQWNTIPATLTFDSTGGSPVAQINTYAGEEIAMPAQPTRPGYAFTGWYESRTSSREVIWPYEVLHDVTLYAGWERNNDAELAATGASSATIFAAAGCGLVVGGSALLYRRTRRQN